MIVADTNLIANFLRKGPYPRDVEAVYEKDSEGVAPQLWRSEFRNVRILSFRRKVVISDEVLSLMDQAVRLMAGYGYQPSSSRIRRLAADSGCSAYDCEFVALALDLGVPLVTADRAVIEKFKPAVVSMETFCS